ncbi:DNA polymerase III subunit beta [Dehalobacterium formicoaceticum]|uniref:Beta sliding clamp n=1 Tax=Dehalobacterium formicoaceticum TaxID=51515 RepID=A0ABT1Y510_9FIRM|nr:DNA polymerase III subunit beta [Dehalobacterium formicoaceticum]MCR6545648.1 DNA polymerase III subunit beta [Dehalobacterium formicoaceticum]
MHFNCSKEDLVYGVQTVSRAVSNKNTKPILSGIHLVAENNALKLTATDSEIAIQCTIEVEVIEEGSSVVPGRYFIEMVKRLPSGIINLKSSVREGMIIKYEQSEQFINGFSDEEFPSLPEIKNQITGSMPQNQFKKMVKQTSIAASNDESRPLFTGTLVEITGDKIIMVTTDSHRLALKEEFWSNSSPVIENKISVIIPTKTMVEVSRIIPDETEPLIMIGGSNQFLFKTSNITVFTRLIEGQYPSYTQVVPDPSKCTSRIRVKTKKLLEAIERASLLVRDELKEKYSLVKLSVDDNILEINSNSPELGKIHEELNVFLEGEPTEIIFNSHYLMDALKSIDEEEIYIDLTGSLSPGIIRSVENDKYIYLILPVRNT